MKNLAVDISVVYQDKDILVANKPSGLLCVPGLREPDNLFDTLRKHFPDIRVVHRLDMATSGIVLFALNYEAQRGLSRLFEQRKIEKLYQAVVAGRVLENVGEVHAPLICDWPNRPKQKVDWLSGKASSTYFECYEKNEEFSRVLLKPITGRSHQLRLHMLQIGHPILGDALYHRDGSQNISRRLLLHAEKIRFRHPITDEDVFIECPADFDLFLK